MGRRRRRERFLILGYDYALCLGKIVKPKNFGLLYHGTDDHPPGFVRVGGLPSKGTDLELWHHAEPPPGNQGKSAFRGSTQLLISTLQDAGAALWGKWVYEVQSYPGYDVAAELEGKIPCPGGFRGVLMSAEQEIAIPAEVPVLSISNAGEVRRNSRGLFIVHWERQWP
jgi:hypothetical protein